MASIWCWCISIMMILRLRPRATQCHVPGGIRSRDLQFYEQMAFRVSYSWSRDPLAHTEGDLFIAGSQRPY
jgi:hypothetical protein